MLSTVEIVRAICKEKKIPISRIEQDLGYGNGYFNPKKAKNIPSDRLTEIARYLDMPVESFLDGGIEETPEKEKKPTPAESGLFERISGLDSDLQSMLIEFVALAQAQPETAKRHLAFAVGELRSVSQGQ